MLGAPHLSAMPGTQSSKQNQFKVREASGVWVRATPSGSQHHGGHTVRERRVRVGCVRHLPPRPRPGRLPVPSGNEPPAEHGVFNTPADAGKAHSAATWRQADSAVSGVFLPWTAACLTSPRDHRSNSAAQVMHTTAQGEAPVGIQEKRDSWKTDQVNHSTHGSLIR